MATDADGGAGEEARVMVRVGEEIQAVRESEKMTSRELARRSGFSASFVCDIQAGRRMPSPETMLRIISELSGMDEGPMLWLLVRELWGEKIADQMWEHARLARAAEGGDG